MSAVFWQLPVEKSPRKATPFNENFQANLSRGACEVHLHLIESDHRGHRRIAGAEPEKKQKTLASVLNVRMVVQRAFFCLSLNRWRDADRLLPRYSEKVISNTEYVTSFGHGNMNTDPNSARPEMESPGDAGPDTIAAQTELATQKDRYLRLAADFDNFRKRTAKETERRAAAQKEAFISELLPVIDNLERALGTDASTSSEQLREGVRMTLQQLHQLLRRHGIEPEESLGKPFDPHYHEAVMTRHDPSQRDRIVLETFQRGYRRGAEVFRPAKVLVNDLGDSEAN